MWLQKAQKKAQKVVLHFLLLTVSLMKSGTSFFFITNKFQGCIVHSVNNFIPPLKFSSLAELFLGDRWSQRTLCSLFAHTCRLACFYTYIIMGATKVCNILSVYWSGLWDTHKFLRVLSNKGTCTIQEGWLHSKCTTGKSSTSATVSLSHGVTQGSFGKE